MRSALEDMTESLLVAILILLVAVLYSSVGQAGGTGYLAVMAVAGVAPAAIRPTALALNIIVASVATLRYVQRGALDWRLLLPFLIGSIPFALLGGSISLPDELFRPALGVVILIAALQTARATRTVVGSPLPLRSRPPHAAAIAAGGIIGLIAGLTGTGGGIFLGPVLLWTQWVPLRRTFALTSGFILVTSAAAMLGNVATAREVPANLPLWAASSLFGGLIGMELAGRWLSPATLRMILAALLAVAGLRLLIAA